MIKVFCFIVSIIIFFGCSSELKWEYKVMTVYPEDSYERTGDEAWRIKTILPSETELIKLGNEGWELVSSYVEMETAFPNFGNDEYVTGIRENVRPQKLVLIFKRPWSGEFDKLVEKK
jgi:hypothetical protein